jgi:hypothetical protein
MEHTCANCDKKGHFAKSCRKEKKVHALQLYYNNCHGDRQQRWTATVKVDGVPIFWELDPGADVTVIPLELFKKKY